MKDLKNDVALLLKATSDAIRSEVKETIEDVVSYALQSVFQEYYTFKIVLDQNGLTKSDRSHVVL